MKWLISFSIPCNSLMFFLRVRALYKTSYSIVALFAFLWASTLSSFTIVFGYSLEVTPIPFIPGGCQSIVKSASSHFITSPFATLVVFDSAVTIAISIHLLSYIPAQSWSSRIKTVFLARDMGRIPRLILRSGQIYYLYVSLIAFRAPF